MRRSILALAGLLALVPRPLTWAAGPGQAQDRPVFRATVDLVTVDVAVVDKDGKPVTRLAPADFTVTASDRPRKVVSADYVTVATGRPKPTGIVPPPPTVPAPTSNSLPPTGRTFMLVIDVGHLTPSSGRAALQTAMTYLDQLDPEDRVGLVVAPYNTPRVDLTTNRGVIRNAVAKVVGANTRINQIMPTVGEAAALERLDSAALTDYLDRIRAGPNDTPPELRGLIEECTPIPNAPCGTTSPLLRWQTLGIRVMQAERQRTRDLFDTLRALATAMSPIDGPKSIILISEGIVNDMGTTDDLRRFALAAERARVTLYALNLAAPLADATSQYNMTTARIRDSEVLLDGMSTLAIAGRGDTFSISGTSSNAFARINAEMSGYYLLSFERDPSDREGQRAGIEVKVNWPGAVVRARKDFVPVKNSRADEAHEVPADLKAAIHDLIRWPVSTIDLGMDVDTYGTPQAASPNRTQTLVAASIASAGRPIVAVGFEVTDSAGTPVADAFEPSTPGAAVTTQRLLGDRQLFLGAVDVPPGEYRMKIAAIDAQGRRGSLEHRFQVSPGRLGSLRMSDVIIGEIAANQLVPAPWIVPGAITLPVSVQIQADSAEALKRASVELELSRPGESPIATMPLTLRPLSDPRRMSAGASLSIGNLQSANYVVTVVLKSGDATELRRSRAFFKR